VKVNKNFGENIRENNRDKSLNLRLFLVDLRIKIWEVSLLEL